LVDQDINLEFQPQDFTQVNPALNNKMLDRVFELLDLQTGDHVVDLFCGMGNVTLPIAKRVKSVIGVEGMQAMVSRAMTNASNNGINNAEFLTANLASENSPKIRQLCAKADIIVLDPPRDGAREIVAQLRDLKKRGQLSARKILYISCNPATLARDTALLVEGGFTLDSLGVLDMFPHTQHVESIALFNA
jgi:23S rRNA (uracil1939-C5)-methyltransferase